MRGPVLVACAAALVAAPAEPPAPVSAGLESYGRAREVLDAGIGALGGAQALRALRSLRRQEAGAWIGSGQHPRPYPFSPPTLAVPPANSLTKLTRFIDYRAGRWLDESVESDFRGEFITRVRAVGEAAGFETITYGDERPFYRPLPAEAARSLLARGLRRYPEGALSMALSRPETLEWVGTAEEEGRKQRVISFSDPAGARVLLHFDGETHLLTRSETLREHALAGDSSAEVVYLDYRRVGPLRLPFHVIDRTAGVPVEEMRASAVELDVPLPEERLRPPQRFARVEEDPAQPAVHRLGDDLYLIRGPYNVVFAVLGDSLVVFEAPLSSRYAETCLELIRATAPGKPVGAVVASHFHYDHVAGIRPFVARGIPILTTPDAAAVIGQVAASRRTMYPDALSARPRPPKVETVVGARVLDGGAMRVELHDFGPTDHVAEILVAYFPRDKVMFVADLWDPISHELHIAGSDAAIMARRVRELRWDVEHIVPVHGVPVAIGALEQGLAVRAKYGR